jgi:hypothetical protein
MATIRSLLSRGKWRLLVTRRLYERRDVVEEKRPLAMRPDEWCRPYGSAVESHQYVAGWGTLTLINAGLAQGKGRSGLAWFLLSLLLGPVATLLIVLSPAMSELEESTPQPD